MPLADDGNAMDGSGSAPTQPQGAAEHWLRDTSCSRIRKARSTVPVPEPRRGVRCERHRPKESGGPCAKRLSCYSNADRCEVKHNCSRFRSVAVDAFSYS